MSETITLNALDLSGESLTLYLRQSDGSLLNTGGDPMSEAGSTGVFTATLAESRDGLGSLAVRICAGAESGDNLLYDGRLNPGTTIIDDPGYAVLDAAERAAIADEVASRELTLTEAYDAAKTAASQASINDVPTVAEFEARTLASAAYATAAQINSLNVNTRANISVPIEIETPDSGTQIYKVRLFLFDIAGNMEAPDSEPTVALVNAAGTDRASRLSAASNPSTGVYSWDYTATDDDTEEQLNWTFTVIEGGLTRVYPATSYIVEETAYRFTSTDRATLNSRASQMSVDDIPTNAELATALSGKATTSDVTTVGTAVANVSTLIGTPATSVSADIAAVKSDTNSLLTRVTSGITALISNLTAMITGTGGSAKFTTVAMSNVTGGGGSGGTPAVTLTLGATIPLTVGQVTGLTEDLVIGDSYTAEVGRRIPITLTDRDGDPVSTAFGDRSLADETCTIMCVLHPENSRNIDNVVAAAQGTCEFVAETVDDPASLWLTLPKVQTERLNPGVYKVQFRATWDDGETVTLAWKGSCKFVRRIKAKTQA